MKLERLLLEENTKTCKKYMQMCFAQSKIKMLSVLYLDEQSPHREESWSEGSKWEFSIDIIQ